MSTKVMIILGACMAVILQYVAALTTVHVVGDGDGWVIPQGRGAGFYGNWAISKKFVVGDVLVFNFATNRHDVVEVPKASYDACPSTDPIGTIITTGPASFATNQRGATSVRSRRFLSHLFGSKTQINITLSSPGDHYYICTFNDHCKLGQKLGITVSAAPHGALPASATPTTQLPSPPTTTTDSPPSTPDQNNLGVGVGQVLRFFVWAWVFIRLFRCGCVDKEERANEEFYQDTALTIRIIE